MSSPPVDGGGIVSLGGKLITSLPAQFLVLVLTNAIFIFGLLWFLDHENALRLQTEMHLADARERVITPLLAACLREKNP